jgi:putative ABC transport system permease protein
MPLGPIVRAMKHNRMRFALIILEIAITLAIVTNCVNMILAERAKMVKTSGFDDDNLLFISATPFAPEFKEPTYVENVVNGDLRAIRAIPGVKTASVTGFLPWQGGGSSGSFKAEGYPDKFQAQFYGARGDLVGTLGTRLAAGRAFTENDTPTDPNTFTTVTIISSGLAKKLWGDNSKAIGRVITTGDGDRPRTVIGVLEEFYNPYSWNIGDYVVFTPGRSYDGGGSTYLVRTEPGAPRAVAQQLEQTLIKVNGGRVFRQLTIPEVKERFFAQNNLVIRGMSAVIVVLIFITALGILGITSLAVSERTKQIGTRRALGATKGDILKHFLTENWIVTTIGLLIGVIAAYGLNFLLLSQVADAKLPWYLVVIGMILLWLNGLVATIPPALRAASVSPAIATRSV